MADLALVATSPLDAWAARAPIPPADGVAGVTLSVAAEGTQFILLARRGQAETLAARLRNQDVELPLTPRRTESMGIAMVCTGPGQWLVRCTADNAERAKRLFAALGALCTIVPADDARLVIAVAGPRAADALAKILPIDLHPRVFGPGCAAVTAAGGISVIVWQAESERRFDCAVPRSFAQDFAQWLAESAAEYGVSIAPGAAF